MSVPDQNCEQMAAEIMAFALEEASVDETGPLTAEAREWLHDRADVLRDTLGGEI